MQPDAPSNIFTIPAGNSFADTLAAYLYDHAKGDPLALARYTVLLPSRRSCRTVRDAFLRLSGGKPTVLPRLQPLGDVDADEIGLHFAAKNAETLDIPPAISPIRRQVILARTVMALYGTILPDRQKPRFDQAVQLAAELAHFLDQVQTEQVPFERLHDLVPEEFAAHWQITLDFLKILTQNWPDILNERGVIDPAERRNRLLHAQSRLWRENPPDYPVIAAGTIASIPATLDVLKTVAGLPHGQIIIPGLDRCLDPESWNRIDADHPQYFLKKLLDHLGIGRTSVRLLPGAAEDLDTERFWSEIMRPAETTGAWRHLSAAPVSDAPARRLQCITCKTQQEEAETIALVLRQVLETPDQTAALVSPDRSLARRVSAALLRWGIDVDDSAGRPLHQAPKGTWLLAVADMVLQKFAPVALLNVLKNPLTLLGFPDRELAGLTAAIEMAALRGVRPDSGLASLRQRLSRPDDRHPVMVPAGCFKIIDALEEATAPLIDVQDDVQPFTRHLKNHLALLETLAGGAERLWCGEDGEALAGFFADLLNLDADLPRMHFRDYVLALRQFLSQSTIRPRYGTHPRISILGQMESRLYVADTMIIAGLNEGRWPPAAQNDPWMSRQMRAGFGLPATTQSAGIAAHDFVQLASGRDVYLTRAVREGGSPTFPSRWLLRMKTVLDASDITLSQQTAADLAGWLAYLDQPGDIRPIKRPAPCPPVAARPRRLSVTGIERLMRDPYEIYAKHVLGLYALEPLDADPAAAERGQLLHRILERFVSACPDRLPDNAKEILLDMGRAEFDAEGIPPEIRNFWWPRFQRLADTYIREEASWRALARPEAIEIKGVMPLVLGPGAAPVTFELSAVADRIDLFQQGGTAIIDYKTGAPPSNKDIEAGYAPQLWLEAMMTAAGAFTGLAAQPVGYIGFWVVSGGHGAALNREIASGDLADGIAATREGLTGVLNCFLDPGTPYIARPNSGAAPRYSDYEHLERVQEWTYDSALDICKVGS